MLSSHTGAVDDAVDTPADDGVDGSCLISNHPPDADDTSLTPADERSPVRTMTLTLPTVPVAPKQEEAEPALSARDNGIRALLFLSSLSTRFFFSLLVPPVVVPLRFSPVFLLPARAKCIAEHELWCHTACADGTE